MEKIQRRLPSKRRLWPFIILIPIIFLIGVGVSYFYLRPRFIVLPHINKTVPEQAGDTTNINIYIPKGQGLQVETRQIKKPVGFSATIDAIMAEISKGSSDGRYLLPPGSKLITAYLDKDGVLYLDMNPEFQRNFKGDALGEYLMIEGIYRSFKENIPDVNRMKILVDGKEVESIGGHIIILNGIGDDFVQR